MSSLSFTLSSLLCLSLLSLSLFLFLSHCWLISLPPYRFMLMEAVASVSPLVVDFGSSALGDRTERHVKVRRSQI